MNYEKDIHIDEAALDIEWLEQASLAIKYGKIWADCQKKLTEAEELIKVTKAELIQKANEDPDKCLGIGIKPTGPNIEAYYRTHEKHTKAKKDWVAAQYELNMASVAKNEISFTRKAALEGLVTLHGQQYFAGPSVPRDIEQEREQKEKKVDTGIGKTLTRRTRRAE